MWHEHHLHLATYIKEEIWHVDKVSLKLESESEKPEIEMEKLKLSVDQKVVFKIEDDEKKY